MKALKFERYQDLIKQVEVWSNVLPHVLENKVWWDDQKLKVFFNEDLDLKKYLVNGVQGTTGSPSGDKLPLWSFLKLNVDNKEENTSFVLISEEHYADFIKQCLTLEVTDLKAIPMDKGILVRIRPATSYLHYRAEEEMGAKVFQSIHGFYQKELVDYCQAYGKL